MPQELAGPVLPSRSSAGAPPLVVTDGDRLLVFTILFAIHAIVHETIEASRWTAAEPWEWILGSVVVVAAAAHLRRPRALPVFTAFVSLSVVQTIESMPDQPNHVLFIGLCSLVLLVSIGFHLVRHDRRPWWDALAATAAPAVRAGFVVVYGFAVLHKLNVDYFDPLVSCGSLLAHGLNLDVFREQTWISAISLVVALLTEAALAVGLAFRRTRVVAICLGLPFHLALSITTNMQIVSFSALVVPLYALFLPTEVHGAIARRLHEAPFERLRQLVVRRRALPLWIVLGVAGSVGVIGFVTGEGGIALLSGTLDAVPVDRLVATALVVAAMLLLAVVLVRDPRLLLAHDPAPAATPAFAVAFVAVLVLNGLSPYIGAKTQTSFSMFSNLRTEAGQTNHLFLPASSLVSDEAEHLVRVTSSSSELLRGIANDGDLVPLFELRRAAAEDPSPDFFVAFEVVGTGETLRAARSGPTDPAASSVFEEPALLSRTLRMYRPVRPLDEPQDCRH